MIIYASLHERGARAITGLSVDSGFKSLADVTANQPGEILRRSNRQVVYESIIFSDFPFYLGESHENI